MRRGFLKEVQQQARKITLETDSDKGTNKCKSPEMGLWLLDSICRRNLVGLKLGKLARSFKELFLFHILRKI